MRGKSEHDRRSELKRTRIEDDKLNPPQRVSILQKVNSKGN